MIGDLWCDRCDDVAVDEYRQPDGSTIALCREHVLDARWKEGNRNWQQGRETPLDNVRERRLD